MKLLSQLATALLVFAANWQTHAADAAGDSAFHALKRDLVLPHVEASAPAAGTRVRATSAGWEGTAVHHILYLPRDWKPDAKLPILVEFAGNGGYRNPLGDVCDGTVEGCHLGFGLSAGVGFIWIAMPFVEVTADAKRNASLWWGDVEETKRYCMATVRDICARYGGDADRVILCGFSRGAIACNFIGLHDDAIAGLWRAFFCHSHYDGVREDWGYPGADRASARQRLTRLHGRPQWISHEQSVAGVESYLRSTGVTGRFTFEALRFPNHTDAWVLCDLPIRDKARAWLHSVLQ